MSNYGLTFLLAASLLFVPLYLLAENNQHGTAKGLGSPQVLPGVTKGRRPIDERPANPDPAAFLIEWFPELERDINRAKRWVQEDIGSISALQRGEPPGSLENRIKQRFIRRFGENPNQARSFMLAVATSSRELERRDDLDLNYIPGGHGRALDFFEMLRAASEAFLRAGGLGVPSAETNYSTQVGGPQETEFKRLLFDQFRRTIFRDLRGRGENPFSRENIRRSPGGRLPYDDSPGAVK